MQLTHLLQRPDLTAYARQLTKSAQAARKLTQAGSLEKALSSAKKRGHNAFGGAQ